MSEVVTREQIAREIEAYFALESVPRGGTKARWLAATLHVVRDGLTGDPVAQRLVDDAG